MFSFIFRIPFLGKSVKYNPHKHPFFVENWYKKGYARSNTDKTIVYRKTVTLYQKRKRIEPAKLRTFV